MVVHQPVLLHEILSGLAVREGNTVLDATVGLGGHAQELAQAVGPAGTLIGMDRDRQVLRLAQDRLKEFGDRVKLVCAHFGELGKTLGQLHVAFLDAALFDLGVSSMQLEDPQRGFSFMREGPLDMRMDDKEEMTAAGVVNHASEPELISILRNYGQERFASRVARTIVRGRPFQTTAELAEAIRKVIPRKTWGRIDPATRSFQAIRIAVNRELELLPQGLAQAMDRMSPGGRLAVVSYHSLEDGIAKRFLRSQAAQGRCVLVTKKPIRPSSEEIKRNPRSRSARLRVAQVV